MKCGGDSFESINEWLAKLLLSLYERNPMTLRKSQRLLNTLYNEEPGLFAFRVYASLINGKHMLKGFQLTEQI